MKFYWSAILDVPELSLGERLTYIALLAHRNERTGRCDPSLGTLARRLRISRRTVIRWLDGLEAQGAIRRTRHAAQRRPAEYELLVWAESTLPATRDSSVTSEAAQLGTPVSLARDPSITSTSDTSVTQLVPPVSPEHANRTRELNTRKNTRAVSANSNQTTSRAEEEATLDAVIDAVRGRRSPPLSRDQAREGRKIARDRLRAGWSVDQIAGALVETAAFTAAAVDFAATGSRRQGRSAAQRSADVLREAIRGDDP